MEKIDSKKINNNQPTIVRLRVEDIPKVLQSIDDQEQECEDLEEQYQEVVNQLGDALFDLGKANKRISDFELGVLSEKEKTLKALGEGVAMEAIRHANRCKKGRSNCLICAIVVGQMSINGLDWSDLIGTHLDITFEED